jgi:Arc/MetJ-type ribon-helix-helix transcriptional regulator
MQLNVPPDLETLIKKRLSSGGYTSVEDVLRRALEAQDAEESWTDHELRALSSHIEEGYLQAGRGKSIRPNDEGLFSNAACQSRHFRHLVLHC